MRGFNFLKRFSSKKEEIKEIKLEELDIYIDSLSKEIIKNKTLELDIIKQRISEEKTKLRKNIKRLEQAELKNNKIPDRAKQIMEGNRKVYIKRLTTLADKIDVPNDFSEILNFCSSFDGILDYLGRGTNRQFHVLQQFFVNETNNIATNIRNINNLVKKIRTLAENSKIDTIRGLKNKNDEIQQEVNQKDKYKEEIKIFSEKLEKQNKNIKEKQGKIKELEESNEYKRYIELIKKSEDLKQQIKEMREKALYPFSMIESALKKYERLTLEDRLVRAYLNDPLSALLKDNELKIVEVLKKMKESISKNELELKDKKKEKILLGVDKLNKVYFKIFLDRHEKLNNNLNEIKSEIEKAEIIKEINEMKSSLKEDKNKLEVYRSKIEEMTKKMELVNIKGLIKGLECTIEKNIGKKVWVTC